MSKKRLLTLMGANGFNKIATNIVLFGDSITLANDTHPTNCGYWNWANAMLGQRLDVLSNAGVGGNSTTQMFARIKADVNSKNARWVFVNGGANDIASDTSADTIYNNLINIYKTCFNNGQRVIATTILPSTSFNTAPRTTIFEDVNDRLRAYALTQSTDKFILSDIAPLYLDTGSAYAVPLAGYTIDGVHPNALGASTVGKQLYTDLVSLIPERNILIADNTDTSLIWFFNVRNPLMTGTSGTKTAPATGNVANNYNVSGGGTWSKLTHDSEIGEWQQGILGEEASQMTLAPVGDVQDTYFSIGKTVYAMMELESDDDWVGAFNIELYLACLNSSNSVLLSERALGYSSVGGSGSAIINPSYAVLRTKNMVIPANTAKIRSYWTFQGTSGTVRLSRYGIKLT